MWLLCILFLLEAIRHVIFGAFSLYGNGNTIDLLFMNLDVHLRSQWQRMLLSLVVTLRWSSVNVQLWADLTGWLCPGPWWLGLVSQSGSRVREKSGRAYHLYTLPLINWHTYIWHRTSDISHQCQSIASNFSSLL